MAIDFAKWRTQLGLIIGTTVQAQDAELSAIAGLTSAADRLPYFTGLGTAALATFTAAGRALVDDADNTAQRTTLGLGTIATQDANNVTITGGSITGITDLAVTDGGTGASTAADARTNLGLAIGTNVQAFDQDLADIAGLVDPDADRLLFWDDSAGAWKHLTLGTNLSITDITLNAASGAGGNTGTTTIDFGAFPGNTDTSVAITGQAGIVAGSIVEANLRLVATADHTADEHWVEELDIYAGNIVAATGFTIYGRTRNRRLYGLYTIAWNWS